MQDTDNIRISRKLLGQLVTSALRALGVPAEQAADASEILVLADMMRIHTHGATRVLSYGERLKIGGIKAAAEMTSNKVAPAVALLDGDNGLGPAIGSRALRDAMAMAQDTGIAMVFVRHSNHFGPIAPYALIAAQKGFASFIASNATTTIAPSGGKEARLGNNPLGFGFPAPGQDPIILDMAMSVVARAKIRDAAAAKQPIPEGWATDYLGMPTTDPAAALKGFLLPMGGYKGYGLSLCVDLMAGLLSGASYLTHVKSWVDEPEAPQDLGHSFILINTKLLMPDADLGDRMSDFKGIIHETSATAPEHPVMLPGQREMQNFRSADETGIVLPGKLISSLKSISGQ
jgi:LDH2 family malate/lactate/ureidoglycolate dehydrogenase